MALRARQRKAKRVARIESDSEHSLQLDIVGYQFPAGERCETDANWLVAELAVAYDDKRWRAREPALLTSEVTALIEWLRHVAVGDAVGGFGAIEPNLSFGAVPDGDAILLSAHFCLEFCRRELDYDQRVEGDPPAAGGGYRGERDDASVVVAGLVG